jgi:hypothetical protein
VPELVAVNRCAPPEELHFQHYSNLVVGGVFADSFVRGVADHNPPFTIDTEDMVTTGASGRKHLY